MDHMAIASFSDPDMLPGWQISATMYRDKINDLFAKMFALKGHVRPAVRNSVDTYLHTVWTGISELTSSIDPYYAPESLREKFQSYVDDEESRLREGLEAVRYDIDAMDTLVLVMGPGRIEKVSCSQKMLLSTRMLNTILVRISYALPPVEEGLRGYAPRSEEGHQQG